MVFENMFSETMKDFQEITHFIDVPQLTGFTGCSENHNTYEHKTK